MPSAGPVTMDRDYVIVGGGLAGLTAARELHRLGCSTIVLEARDRVGGRAWYGKGPADVWVEFGGAYIHPSQPNVWQEVVDHSLPITAPTPPRSAAWLTCNNLRRGGPPVPYPEFSDLERAHDAWVEAARSLKDNRDRRSLDIPVSEFYASLALGPHTVDLLAAFFGEHCSNEWTEGSMLPFAQWLLETNSSVNDLIAGATLSPQLSNGTRSLVEAVALEAGEIRLRSPVRHVDQRSDAVEIATDDDVVTARAAVIAIPLNAWRTVHFQPPLSEQKLRLARQRHAGRGAKVLAVVENSPSLVDFAMGLGSPFYLVLADRTVADRQRLIVAFGPDADAIDPTDPRAVEAGLAAFMPDIRVVGASGHNWLHDPWSAGTWFVPRPGQLTSCTENLDIPEGRLAFAGSDIADSRPGSLDGAIHSGKQAAAVACQILALSQREPH